MTVETTELHPEAWLYTREDESVRVEVHEDNGVWAASITGPGSETRVRLFRDQGAFDTFRSEHNRELLSRGFRLRAISERRGPETAPAAVAMVVRHERRRR